MSFSGKYQLESQENFEPFIKAIGLPDKLIHKGKDIKSISEIKKNGYNFKVTIITSSRIFVNVYTIGKGTELETVTGEKIKAQVHHDSNKLKVCLKEITREFTAGRKYSCQYYETWRRFIQED